MKVISLGIRKNPNYVERPNEIEGTVEIEGSTGKMEVRLFPKTVAAIFALCREDVQKVAMYNVTQAADACDHAADTIMLQVTNGELKQLESRIV